ncbi:MULTISPECIES: helix-turn-helix domain-containing protein [Vibrio]|uniref:Helix-turn-helix domain-containing protein n=2 Tax=Vibrio TaxID=662 RepID=A0A7X4LNX1_9VIBR|nr:MULTISPECIES: helix-turn-helix transcriptional regulator [Vibrio]MBF9002924.1 helix-turn-helix transcriptional regulator [Vibrio nitrifigilis]MZI95261.1 helix-turn-helix domain-containing protein [Vibrio eleionomae]
MDEPFNINQHVGQRIRAHRKMRNLTIQQLADHIHKSRATVSKYETGEISLDMVTLFKVATALQIAPNQLIDYHPEDTQVTTATSSDMLTFHNARKLYFYFYDGRYKRLKDGVIEISPHKEGNQQKATLTISVVTPNGRNSEIYYVGTVIYSDRLIRFSFINQYNRLEESLLYIFTPLELRDSTYGLLCGISSADMRPCAIKSLVTLTPQTYSDDLKSQLLLTKQELKESSKLNMLVVDNLL